MNLIVRFYKHRKCLNNNLYFQSSNDDIELTGSSQLVHINID
jgi:hypothetical protein